MNNVSQILENWKLNWFVLSGFDRRYFSLATCGPLIPFIRGTTLSRVASGYL